MLWCTALKSWGDSDILCMMEIPLTGPSYVYGDNKLQVTNSTQPESTLKKKCNYICYHAVRESVAMGESSITHISTGHNHSDLMTKVSSDSKRRRLVGGILYDIYDDHSQQWRQDQPVTVMTAWSWGDWRNMPMCITETHDWTPGVKSIFLCTGPVASAGVSLTLASRTRNSCALAYSASFRSHNSY